jgi:hypothetical protein
MRSGTLATHQIVGMGAAFASIPEDFAVRTVALRERLWQQLQKVPGVIRNGDPDRAAPHILNVSFQDVEGESLRAGLFDVALSAEDADDSLGRDEVEPRGEASDEDAGTGGGRLRDSIVVGGRVRCVIRAIVARAGIVRVLVMVLVLVTMAVVGRWAAVFLQAIGDPIDQYDTRRSLVATPSPAWLTAAISAAVVVLALFALGKAAIVALALAAIAAFTLGLDAQRREGGLSASVVATSAAIGEMLVLLVATIR